MTVNEFVRESGTFAHANNVELAKTCILIHGRKKLSRNLIPVISGKVRQLLSFIN